MPVPTVAIVGANVGGVRTAESLRRLGYDGRIVLVSAETHEPYERPPLSKKALLGELAPSDISLRQDWDDLDVELLLGETVSQISPSDASLTLASGAAVRADRIVLATGGGARPLTAPGAELKGVHSLRDMDHALELRESLITAQNVVVIGGGFIGLEVAATAHTLGAQVTVLEAGTVPLSRALGARWGGFVADRHLSNGVQVRTGASAVALRGGRRVESVELADGTSIPAQAVVIGIGMIPRTELADEVGLSTPGGIVVDDHGRTANPGVFAVGDVTLQPAWRGSGLVRYESFQNAEQQAIAVASVIAGSAAHEREIPWFWSDQFDMNIQIAGDVLGDDVIVYRGDVEGSRFAAFHLRGDEVAGVVGINAGRDVRAAMGLIAGRVSVTRAELADTGIDLRRLARSRAAFR